MKTIIAGGRDYKFTAIDIMWLNRLMHTLPITSVISGGANGADHGGEEWAHNNKLPLTIVPAKWEMHGNAAGPLRNQEMANMANILIAFPGARGTADMIRRAKANGLVVIIREART